MIMRWLMPAWRHAPCLLLLLFCGTACRKVDNTNMEARNRPLWFFFNYKIENPNETIARLKREKIKTNLYEGLTLRVFIWTNYLPQSVLDGFTKNYGAKVKLAHYETDHELRAKLLEGERYDLVMPAGFGAERLISEGLLEPLNHKLLPRLSNIGREFQTNLFDPGMTFVVPYLWSTAGIAYNFGHLDHIPHKWKDLFAPDEAHAHELVNHVALLPGPIRSYSAALLHLGYSPNTTSTNQLGEAARLLSDSMAKLQFRFMRSGVTSALVREEVWMALAYSSEASRAAKANHHIHFVVPDDGTWLTMESFGIPKGTSSRHAEMAHAFINYLLEPVVAARVVEHSYHASTIPTARPFIDSEIKLGPPYNRPKHVGWQHYNQVAELVRDAHWAEFTNRFPSAMQR